MGKRKSKEIDVSKLLPLDEDIGLDAAPQYRPLGLWSRLAQLACLLVALVWGVHLVIEVDLSWMTDGGSAVYDKQERANSVFLVACLVSLGAMAVIALWTVRAYRNWDSWAQATESPVYVLVSWFVPVLNLIVPAKAIEELYSDPEDQDRPSSSLLVWLWWFGGPVVLAVVLGLRWVETLVFPEGRLQRVLEVFTVVTDATLAGAFVIGVVVVARVSASQARRKAALTPP